MYETKVTLLRCCSQLVATLMAKVHNIFLFHQTLQGHGEQDFAEIYLQTKPRIPAHAHCLKLLQWYLNLWCFYLELIVVNYNASRTSIYTKCLQ